MAKINPEREDGVTDEGDFIVRLKAEFRTRVDRALGCDLSSPEAARASLLELDERKRVLDDLSRKVRALKSLLNGPRF